MNKALAIGVLWCAFGAESVARAGAIVIDHNGVDVSVIPADSIAAAASLRVLLRHASVGQGIGWGLDCLAGLKSNQSACKCFPTGKYDRSKWVLEARMGDGRSKIDDLVTQVATRADQFDVFMMKYCYIDALANAHPDWEYYRSRMEQLEAQYPAKRFVWWTIPLTRDGQPGSDVFNALVRSYCAANGKILFDIADIECHDAAGVRLTNAQGNETISQSYTQEIHAGHLNVEGRIRVASALWRLMAAIAADLQEPPGPRVIYVDDDATERGDGSSWDNAYRHLQDALAAARTMAKPVEIRVAQGTYRPDRGANKVAGDTRATFALVDAVALRGGYAGVLAANPDLRDPREYETVLSGDLRGNDTSAGHLRSWHPTRFDNCEHVVTGLQVTAATTLDGFIITGGNNGAIFRRDDLSACGPGVYLDEASPTLTNCRFEGNYTLSGDGGALFNFRSSAPSVIDCIFSANSAGCGGAVCNVAESDPTIVNCQFFNNQASWGGALFSRRSGPHVSNCVFSGNRVIRGGGAVCFEDRDYGTIINCTFYGNHADFEGGAIWSARSVAPSPNRITNCILWENSPEEILLADSDLLVSHCSVAGGWPGDGNIESQPLFADPGYWDPNGTPDDPDDDLWVDGDYHLQSQAGRWDPNTQDWITDGVTSPCIDAGDPNSPVGEEPLPNGGRINMGVYGGTAEASKSPFDE